jgi:hypothetical protein
MPFRDFTCTETTTVTLVTQKRYAMKRSVYLVASFALLIAVEYDMEVAAGTTKTVAVDYKSF